MRKNNTTQPREGSGCFSATPYPSGTAATPPYSTSPAHQAGDANTPPPGIAHRTQLVHSTAHKPLQIKAFPLMGDLTDSVLPVPRARQIVPCHALRAARRSLCRPACRCLPSAPALAAEIVINFVKTGENTRKQEITRDNERISKLTAVAFCPASAPLLCPPCPP